MSTPRMSPCKCGGAGKAMPADIVGGFVACFEVCYARDLETFGISGPMVFAQTRRMAIEAWNKQRAADGPRSTPEAGDGQRKERT